MPDSPEKRFQNHIARFLRKVHGYTPLESREIQDDYIAQQHLLDFIHTTQAETYARLETDYTTDAPQQIMMALREELAKAPLWLIMREGLKVRGQHFQLYSPKPRSSASTADHTQNRFSFKTELVVGDAKRPDIVLFLNGLPISVIELKHEATGQNVHDAVTQFTQRSPDDAIFRLPFLYIAADTSEVKVATNPQQAGHFRWFNTGLENLPETEGEYPVEYLYRHVLARDAILQAISFYLVYVPQRTANPDKGISARDAFSLFPRYHQSRMVERLAADIGTHFAEQGHIGKKYLINHSAGSGKTLSISWLADRLNSLYLGGTSTKLVDMVFVLTDRKSLDKNIRDELENFHHLRNVIRYAKTSQQLKQHIARRESIIVSTQQKFVEILKELESLPELKTLRVAYLIDEAHRSQEGSMATAVRKPFRDTPDVEEDSDPEQALADAIRAHDHNQLFVAFTATPSNTTVQLFGAAFDTYSEAEAIHEKYIVDVAASIISYKTLFHLQSPVIPPDADKLYPAGVLAKALQNVAFQDEGLIQYKAELMLRIFDEDIKPLVNGQAKAMIVASSRLAGLLYYRILKEKLREKREIEPERYAYDVLYAFSDFDHPETHAHISEHTLNGLDKEELIEERFDTDGYRLMVVASKFQTGFDQPLLAGMFLDKPVQDRNAVQTISRLNRCAPGKEGVVVVDFTNNADKILKAFNKYRQGTPYTASEPDQAQCKGLYLQILDAGIFTADDAETYLRLAGQIGQDQQAAGLLAAETVKWRGRFNSRLASMEERKAFVYLLTKFARSYQFLSCFFAYADELAQFAAFAEFLAPQLIKAGSTSELMTHIGKLKLEKAAVTFQGIREFKPATLKPRSGGGGNHEPPPKTTISDMIEKLRERFQISEAEALVIREVCEEKVADPIIFRHVQANRHDRPYLERYYQPEVRTAIETSYASRALYQCLLDEKYIDPGSIFDIMAHTVIYRGLENRIS